MNNLSEKTKRSDYLKIFVLCAIAYSFSYIGRMNYSACIPSIIEDGVFDKVFGGFITTAYLICYATGQLINGFVSNKVSPKYMVGFGLAGVSGCNILMGLLPYKEVMLIIWGLNGFFNSMLWTPIIRAFAEWLPEKQRQKAGVNISVTIPLGTLCSYLIPAFLLRFTSWKVVFFVCGGTVLIACITWFSGMISLNGHLEELYAVSSSNECTSTGDASITKDSGTGISNDNTVKVFIRSGLPLIALLILFNGALKDSVTSWTPTYLYDTFRISDSLSAFFTSFLPIISVFGAYVAHFFDSKFFKNEVLTCGAMFGISLLSIGLLYLFGSISVILSATMIAISTSAMWGINTMLLTFVPFHFGKIHKASSVSGTLNCFSYISSSICSTLFGMFASSFGWHTVTLLWLALAVAGMLVAVLIARAWSRRRSIYEQ